MSSCWNKDDIDDGFLLLVDTEVMDGRAPLVVRPSFGVPALRAESVCNSFPDLQGGLPGMRIGCNSKRPPPVEGGRSMSALLPIPLEFKRTIARPLSLACLSLCLSLSNTVTSRAVPLGVA